VSDLDSIQQKLESALFQLSEVNFEEVRHNSLSRDGAIQRFEFCVELFWKWIQARLLEESIEVASPKAAFQKAFQMGWLEDELFWLGMLKDRNLSSHTYNEELAIGLFEKLPRYLEAFQRVYGKYRS
jgi:nucleotidyltransferase substrate binding protein (TIGR01987 family)